MSKCGCCSCGIEIAAAKACTYCRGLACDCCLTQYEGEDHCAACIRVIKGIKLGHYLSSPEGHVFDRKTLGF